MEKFIKENESEFLNYIDYEKEFYNKIGEVKGKISKLKSEVMSKNIDADSKFYEEIEVKRKRIYEINVEMNKIGIGKQVNNVKPGNKELNNYYADIEIEKLNIEKNKLEDEIKQILSVGSLLIEIDKLSLEEKNLNIERNEKSSKLLDTISDEIKNKEDLLVRINEINITKMNELKDKIADKQEVLDEIYSIEYEEEELEKIKEKTITRLEKEIESLKEELQVTIDEVEPVKQGISDEIENLKGLKKDIKSGSISSEVKQILGIEEEKAEEEIEDVLPEYDENEEIERNEIYTEIDEEYMKLEESEIEEKEQEDSTKVVGIKGKAMLVLQKIKTTAVELFNKAKEFVIKEYKAYTDYIIYPGKDDNKDIVLEQKEIEIHEEKSLADRLKEGVNQEQQNNIIFISEMSAQELDTALSKNNEENNNEEIEK